MRKTRRKKKMKNRFITFEGIDGSGKSTQIQMLYEYLSEKNEKVLLIREPGTTSIGEKIREILTDKKNNAMSYMTEALLFMSSRAQLVHEIIIPALKENTIVICDRFIDSSVVYQGIGRGLGKEFIENLNQAVTCNIMPDITFFLDIKPEDVWLRKIGLEESDRLEAESLDFHSKIYNAYKMLASKNKNRIVTIDANNTPEVMHQNIIDAINTRF